MKKNILLFMLLLFSYLNLSFAENLKKLGPGYVCKLSDDYGSIVKSRPKVKVYLYDLNLNDTHTRSWARMIVDDYTWSPTRTIAKGIAKLFPQLGGLDATVYGFQLSIGKAVTNAPLWEEFEAVGNFYLDDSDELYGTCYWKNKINRPDL